MLFPLSLEFSTSDIKVIKQLQPDLESAGFTFSEINDDSAIITGVPVGVSEEQVASVLEQLISVIRH